MKDIYIKTNEFTERELEKINKYAYRDYRSNDIMNIEELIITIEELLGKCEELEDELEQTKNYEEERETFDYSEWKANQE